MIYRQITLMGGWRGEVRKWRLRQRVCLAILGCLLTCWTVGDCSILEEIVGEGKKRDPAVEPHLSLTNMSLPPGHISERVPSPPRRHYHLPAWRFLCFFKHRGLWAVISDVRL